MDRRKLAALLLLCGVLQLLAGCSAGGEPPAEAEAYAEDNTLTFDTPGAQLEQPQSAGGLVHATPLPAIVGGAYAPGDSLAFTLTPSPAPASTPVVAASVSSGLTPAPSPVATPTSASSPTPTPAPTPTPSPTPKATPSYTWTTVHDEKAHVRAKGVNLREGPGQSYDVMMVMEYLQTVNITAKTTIEEDGESHVWYRVEFDDTEGYLRKDLVTLGAAPTPTPKPTATPKPANTPEPVVTPEPEIQQGSSGSYPEEDIYLAAKLIYAEGKNQSTDSFRAMANVLYNRVNSSSFGGTVEQEVYRSNQFTVVRYDSFEGLTPSSAALSAAREVFNEGLRVIPDNVMFFRSASRGKDWGKRKFYKEIGGNNYYS